MWLSSSKGDHNFMLLREATIWSSRILIGGRLDSAFFIGWFSGADNERQ